MNARPSAEAVTTDTTHSQRTTKHNTRTHRRLTMENRALRAFAVVCVRYESVCGTKHPSAIGELNPCPSSMATAVLTQIYFMEAFVLDLDSTRTETSSAIGGHIELEYRG